MSPAGYRVRDSFSSSHIDSPSVARRSLRVPHLHLIRVGICGVGTSSYSQRTYPFGSPLVCIVSHPPITSASSACTCLNALCAFLVPLIGAPMRIHFRINSGLSSSLGCPVLHRYQCASSCLSIDLYSTSPFRSLTR